MTRVLLTGASGFVGSHVLEVLLTRGDCDVVVISSFTCNGTSDRIADVVAHFSDGDVTAIRHDLTAPLSTRQRSLVGDVDWIVDVASRSSVDESLVDPTCFILNNLGVTLTTLELARELRPSRYVHLSTDEVYGPGLATSATDHRPSSPYAASKAAQEDVCHAYARSYGVPLTLATSANMFGPRQSDLAFLPRIVRAALRDESIQVHTHDDQPGVRRYNYVGDVATHLVDALRGDDASDRLTYPGRYTLDNLALVHYVWYFASELIGRSGSEPRVELVEGASVRPGYDPTYASLGRLNGWLTDAWSGVQATSNAPLVERLLGTVEWYVAHPEWLAS